MDFGLSDEQLLLQKNLAGYLEEALPITRIRELAAATPGADAGAWKGLAELGIAGILIPESHGGAGLGMLDAVVAAEVFGAAVAPAPFLASAVLAPVALLCAGSEAQQAAWLPPIATGDVRIAAALGQAVSRREDAAIVLDDGRLRGRALMTIDSLDADRFLVAVDVDGARCAGLALVDPNAEGSQVERLETVDRTRAFAELVLDGPGEESFEWLGEPGTARPQVDRILDAGRIVLAGDILGAAGKAIEKAVAYSLQRKQFDRLIGSFQAVKHMCAEMIAELEPARSLVWYAAHCFDEGSEDAALMIALAKAHLSDIGNTIVRTATEVHGGIGFTDEQNLHYWFKRVGVDRQLLGSPSQLRARAAELQGWSRA